MTSRRPLCDYTQNAFLFFVTNAGFLLLPIGSFMDLDE